jgi:hypothetical protein
MNTASGIGRPVSASAADHRMWDEVKSEGTTSPELALQWSACSIPHRSTSTSRIVVGECCLVNCLESPAVPVERSMHVWGHYQLMRVQSITQVPTDGGSQWVVGMHPFTYRQPDDDTVWEHGANSNCVSACTVWDIDASVVYRPAADVIRPVQCVHLCTTACKLPDHNVN